jgi:hypothetical protein
MAFSTPNDTSYNSLKFGTIFADILYTVLGTAGLAGWIDVWMDGCMDGWMGGWTDGCIDGWMGVWMDG